MKGGFYGLKGKQFSLFLIALVCTTILLWAWEKTPLLTVFLPPKSQLWKPSPEISINSTFVSSTISKPDINVKEVLPHAAPEKETTEKEEQTFGIESPLGFVTTKAIYNTDNSSATPPMEKRGITMITSEEDTKPKQHTDSEKETKQLEPNVNVMTPMASAITNSSTKEDNATDSKISLIKQECNYARGKWIPDDSRPLYSGFHCKEWLSEMWACRLTQRTDFSYERFRWKPQNCEMPQFKGSKFLRRMKNKTLALVGDSLGRQQFQSLMCMVTGGKESPNVIDVGREYGLVKARGAIRPDGWAYRFPSTNTTILYYWSSCLCGLDPLNISNPATNYAMHLDRPPAFLERYLHRFDILVLNTGHHWNRGKLRANRWVMHVNGIPNTNKKIAEIGGAKNFTIYSIVKWVDSQLPKHPRLTAFFRTISPRHFFNGDWNSGGSCDNTTPLGVGKEVLEEESSDPISEGAVKGTRVKLLDITALSQLRDEGHISRYSIKATPGVQDCLHWCLPGVPDTWNEILAAQM